jgi:hypothetical protein
MFTDVRRKLGHGSTQLACRNVQHLEVADLQPTSRGTTSSIAQGRTKGHERIEEPAPTHLRQPAHPPEYLIISFRNDFPSDVVELAQRRIDRENRIQDQGGLS